MDEILPFEMLLSLIPGCLAVAAALWARARVRDVEATSQRQERQIALLTQRVFELERGAAPHASRPAKAPPAPIPFVSPQAPVFPPPPIPLAASAAPPAVYTAPPLIGPALEPPRDLEAVIGTNWLSKLGVLILLIGIALFLGFSLTSMGPLGRVATGALTSLALLGAGVAAERRADYRTLGSALIGGGWAGLYFTTFAAHGIEAARVIADPGAAFLLLIAVAAGMIGHSLRYRSQTVTGLAYMAAFLTIAVSSLTRFSAVASIPLLLSLLAVSWRFGWQPLAAAGAFFAYLAYGFDLATGDKDRYFVAFGEPVIWIYWLVLEAYDIAMLRKFRAGAAARYLPVSPMNLTGFLLATAAVWPASGWQPDIMLGAMATAQLLSALLRGSRTGSGELSDSSTFGGYRASLTFSSALAAAFIVHSFAGWREGIALALLAQSVALAGWMFRSPYLRGLGAVLFLLPVFAAFDNFGPAESKWWPSLYTLLAALGLLNRTLLQGGVWYSVGSAIAIAAVGLDFRPDHFRPALLTVAAAGMALLLRWRQKAEAPGIGLALACVSSIALLAQIPSQIVWIAIGLPALVYAAFGSAMAEGTARGVVFAAMHVYAGALLYRWIGSTPWLMAALLALALAAWFAGRRVGLSLAVSALLPEIAGIGLWCADWLGVKEPLGAKLTVTGAIAAMYLTAGSGFPRAMTASQAILAVVFGATFLQEAVSGRALTLAWGLEAAAVLAGGFALRRRLLRLLGLFLFALCLGKLFFYDFSQLDTLSRILSFIVLGCLLIAASWAYTRFREQIQRYL